MYRGEACPCSEQHLNLLVNDLSRVRRQNGTESLPSRHSLRVPFFYFHCHSQSGPGGRPWRSNKGSRNEKSPSCTTTLVVRRRRRFGSRSCRIGPLERHCGRHYGSR